jgi:hypothetical protein
MLFDEFDDELERIISAVKEESSTSYRRAI